MKKLYIFTLSIILTFIFSLNSFAAPETVSVIVNGNALTTDTPAVIRNSRTMVPFRALFEALGANQIFWDEPTQTVMGSDGVTTIKLVIGSYDIDVNGNTITMDTPPMIINSRTMIPLSAVSSSLGATVEWNPVGYIATVTKGGVVPNVPNNISQIQPSQDTQISNPTQSNDAVLTPMNYGPITGYYAIEDLKRNKYVLNLGENGKAELIDINSKNSVQGTYSYNNSTLSLKVSNFNSTYTREDASYNKNNLILMKDNTNTTSGSTFVMMKISQDEYNKYVK
ncbi:hypothetical protein HMPREF9630_01724 [Peptoanaerobacter stomatis]|uniref:Copper amine oxidase-like N-terminal domain-containing protein n=1 Tax=Peptoanaerobacter stomatis TaxID=796937 RepID=V9HU61_9FIRM|nr:copper amine oxidase N-terminal domain-containing protein [Peptoanaerobacter stomatis]EHL17138.1 hypothetical protein HMPREF9630_01724 [Peptoanaerobacter stomatis]